MILCREFPISYIAQFIIERGSVFVHKQSTRLCWSAFTGGERRRRQSVAGAERRERRVQAAAALLPAKEQSLELVGIERQSQHEHVQLQVPAAIHCPVN